MTHSIAYEKLLEVLRENPIQITTKEWGRITKKELEESIATGAGESKNSATTKPAKSAKSVAPVAPVASEAVKSFNKEFNNIKTQIKDEIATAEEIFNKKEQSLTTEESQVLSEMRSKLIECVAYDLRNRYMRHDRDWKKERIYINKERYSNLTHDQFVDAIEQRSIYKDNPLKSKLHSPNITKFILDTMQKEDNKKVFITHNGFMLNSLTKAQRDIIQKIDRSLKEGKAASININLGVGEGKTFLLDIIDQVYGVRIAKTGRINLKNGAEVGFFLKNITKLGPTDLFSQSNIPIFSLSLSDLAGNTKDTLREKLAVIKESVEKEGTKGKKALVLFDEFPHLNNDLKSLIRKTLPSECTMAFVTATPNVIALINSNDQKDRDTLETVEAKKKDFVAQFRENKENIVFEHIKKSNGDAFAQLKKQTELITPKIEGQPRKVQWILPDLKPEQLDTFLYCARSQS